MPTNGSESSAMQRLQDEFQKLTDEQHHALQDAIYFGMAPDVATECEGRRARIAQIVGKMGDLAGIHASRT